jgi:excisionase family DNA binding protein
MNDAIRPISTATHTPPREYFGLRLKTGAGARYLGISRRYLAQLTAQGRVPFHRLGPRCIIYARSDLDAFLADHRVDPAAVTGRR